MDARSTPSASSPATTVSANRSIATTASPSCTAAPAHVAIAIRTTRLPGLPPTGATTVATPATTVGLTTGVTSVALTAEVTSVGLTAAAVASGNRGTELHYNKV